VSTDKAANPVNVMGASKKLMEEVILAYSGHLPVTTARFANVAFSNGSLLAGFIERLMKRQPLSAPADVKRYFVSPEESGQLCLLACVLGRSGEILFPKLGEDQMLTFAEIASAFLRELGYEPDECSSEQEAREKAARLQEGDRLYPVYYFNSDTSGEKSFEEFYTDEEEIDWDRFHQLGVICNAPRKSMSDISDMFDHLNELFARPVLDKQAIVRLMQDFIPNFGHIETGKGLDMKM
jgi:FlaA1/EpsC-like NDP-sugar epimerase